MLEITSLKATIQKRPYFKAIWELTPPFWSKMGQKAKNQADNRNNAD
jgi:hypothetical protein